MKFFKHFTDAHRGRSLQSLKNRLGMDGIGRYWVLVEICAEKMTKNKEEEYTEEHCRFTFDRRYLRDTLATHQISGVEKFLRCLTDVELMSYTSSDDVVEIYMPKLLESLDRDTKRARKLRDDAALKRKNKEKEEEKDIDKEKSAPKAQVIDPFFRQKFDNKKLPIVAEIWNQHCGEKLTKLSMTTKAWNRASDLLLEDYSVEQIETAIKAISENKFLTGGSRSNWRATFSWLIKGDNLAKVLVGDYDNEQSIDAMLEEMRELIEEGA